MNGSCLDRSEEQAAWRAIRTEDHRIATLSGRATLERSPEGTEVQRRGGPFWKASQCASRQSGCGRSSATSNTKDCRASFSPLRTFTWATWTPGGRSDGKGSRHMRSERSATEPVGWGGRAVFVKVVAARIYFMLRVFCARPMGLRRQLFGRARRRPTGLLCCHRLVRD
jgi:hypothetical protein